MKHERARSMRRAWQALGTTVCALGVAAGCGPAGREVWKEILGGHGGHGPGGGGQGGGGQGGSGNEPPASCAPIDFDDLYEIINDDLSGADSDDARNYRYLTLANRHDAGLCSAEAREADRRAIVKGVNMLSTAATIAEPIQVDAEDLVFRVDMRDYEWDRAVSVGGANFVDAWEAVAENNPYAVRLVGDDADDAVADSQTLFPFMFADSFLAAATAGELYYALLDVPEDVDAFIVDHLGIDIEQNLLDQEVIRAGFSGASSGLPGNAFLAERHDIEFRAGYLWQISDFGGDLAALIEDPLAAPQGERRLVFTLENGLLGFALADAGGQRLDASALLRDPSQPNLAYSIAVSAIAEFASGVDVTDQVRRAALGNPRLSPREKAIVREIYPEATALATLLDDDRERFYARALTRAGLDISDPEPIGALLASFAADVDLATAAGDVLLGPEQFRRNIRELPEAVQILGSPGGKLDRGDWTALYVQSLCILSVALENAPDVAVCDAAFANP